MFETRTVSPSGTVVSISEAKASARIDHDDEDLYVDSLIASAQSAVEKMTGRALLTQTWRQELGWAFREKDVRLMRTPVQSLISIEYFDGVNAEQTATLGDFRLYGADDRWFVRPQPGAEWPELYARPDALRITYVAGYGAADDVPQELKTAVLLLVGHWYTAREAASERSMSSIPYGVRHLTELYRAGWVGA